MLVETVFSWGGVAQYGASAMIQKDFAAIQGFVLITASMTVLLFLIIDVVYMMLDPRVRV